MAKTGVVLAMTAGVSSVMIFPPGAAVSIIAPFGPTMVVLELGPCIICAVGVITLVLTQAIKPKTATKV